MDGKSFTTRTTGPPFQPPLGRTSMHDLILGTAGHIDHGKTSLIAALTGVDTDRLPEEKRRGITIELGFAELVVGEYRFGIVDVPGHERFVRNMLAGATGMDLALLVISAGESIKQQTREHLDILRMLRLTGGVVALTKCDLAEPDWIEMVEEEIRELVAGSCFEGAPILRTSTVTGEGIEELKQALLAAAEKCRLEQSDEAPFRMAIDRTFSIAGHGTVVTGSVAGGRAAVGDELVVQPGGKVVRIRGLQNHDRTVEEVHRGQRAAINLAGLHYEESARGEELASPGYLEPTRRLTVQLRMLPSAPRPLRQRARIRLHVGTAEVMATVALLGTDRLPPGECCLAQLFLSEPVVATWNQPFVARAESPVMTIGGGRVLHPSARRIKVDDAAAREQLRRLTAAEPEERAAAAIYFFGLAPWKAADLIRSAGASEPEALIARLTAEGKILELSLSPTRTLRVERTVFEEFRARVETLLGKMHDAEPLRVGHDPGRVLAKLSRLASAEVLHRLLEELQRTGAVQGEGGLLALPGRGPKLSANERKLLSELLARFQAAGFEPPTPAQCREGAAHNRESVPQLLALAAADGRLVRIGPEFFLHAEAEQRLREMVGKALREAGGLTVSQIRELLGTSRKYAVPLCEYLDSIGFTRREGDVRRAAES